MLGKLAIAIGEVGGNIVGPRGLRGQDLGPRRGRRRQLHAATPTRSRCARAIEGIEGVEILEFEDRTFDMHEGGKIEVLPARAGRATATTSRWPTRRAWPGSASRSRRTPSTAHELHDQEEHRRHRHRRHRGARPRRHRARGRPAGHGGQGAAVQELRRRRRLPDLPRHQGPPTRSSRPSCASPRPSAASTSRTSPPRVLRGRGAPARTARHPGLPRRPARHRGRHARRARERAEDRRQADGRPQGRHRRRRRRRRRHRPRSSWTPGVPNIVGCDRQGAIRDRPRRPQHVQAVVRREHQPRAAHRLARTRSCRAPTCSSASAVPT